MDTAQWPQGIGLVKPMEGSITSSSTTNTSSTTAGGGGGGARPSAQVVERRARPQKEQALNCPRCNSTNTKFCYYNNYSLTQPRYFCKTCRRYWTEGGSLRNVPVGGGSRKNKKSSSSSSSASASTATTSTTTSTLTPSSTSTSSIRINPPPMSLSTSQNPKFHQGQDLNLAFPHPSTLPEFGDLPSMDNSSATTNPSTSFSAMELLRSGMSARGLSPFIPMPMSMSMPMPEAGVGVYPAGFGLQDFRPPTLSFPLDGVPRGGGGHVAAGASAGNEYGGMQSVQENAGRLLFPFEDLGQVPSGSGAEFEQNRGNQAGDPPRFWNAMMGGGGGGGSW